MSDNRQTSNEYPAHYETEVVLKDGSRIFIRPIKKDDTENWLAFISGLSSHTKYLRFHYMPKQFAMEDARRFCTVDYNNTFAFVAEEFRNRHKQIIAIGRYYRLPNNESAEVAFVIEDQSQDRGIATKLMEWLANVARNNGITSFEADVLHENQEMMGVFQNYGFHVTSQLRNGIYHITFPIARTKMVTKKEEERERISTVTSLHYILRPRSVAVIGASRTPGSLGQLIFKYIIQNGYTGLVYPVNPHAEAVTSVRAYPSILDVPGDVDLGIIVVPAPIVAKVADECGRKGVRALIVISDGFSERGPEGATLEKELRNIALGHGMRLIGPNCMGIINTDSAVQLNATFSQFYPPSGNVAFLSQSGALGLSILDYANNLNIGISTFVSVGNRVDVSANDFLLYWEQDPATKVILLYLESFGNPRKFARIARKLSAKKPILVLKSGSTPAGSHAASSHTGALATPEITSDALFYQAGITRVDTLEKLFDLATLLSNQPVPKGNRVVIVTNGGGPGILAADACERQRLSVPDLSPELVAKLKTVVKRDIVPRNPLDMTAGATAEEYEGVLKMLATDIGNDAVITIFIPPVVVDPASIEHVIRDMAPFYRRHDKPLLTCFMGQRGFKQQLGTDKEFVPGYPFPEDAVSALAKAVEYGEMSRKPRSTPPKIRGLNRRKARKMVDNIMTQNPERPFWLSFKEICELFDCYDIRIVKTRFARTADEAAIAASEIGFPVAVKLDSTTIVHKTDVGGVKLDLKSKEEVKNAFHDIKDGLTKLGHKNAMKRAAVQQMLTGGVEAIVGVKQDPSFGPLIMFGLGGIYTELFEDVAARLHPLTVSDAKELISSIKTAKLFDGFRGSPPSDKQAVEGLLLRLSALVEDIPEIVELDMNPVKVLPQGEGCYVIDARILMR